MLESVSDFFSYASFLAEYAESIAINTVAAGAVALITAFITGKARYRRGTFRIADLILRNCEHIKDLARRRPGNYTSENDLAYTRFMMDQISKEIGLASHANLIKPEAHNILEKFQNKLQRTVKMINIGEVPEDEFFDNYQDLINDAISATSVLGHRYMRDQLKAMLRDVEFTRGALKHMRKIMSERSANHRPD